MENRKHLWKEIFWSAVIIQLTMFATATNVTTPTPQQETTEDSSKFAWSAWGSWSPCSRTCGGGVSVQERQCLPRTRTTIPEGTLPPPIITVRVTREVRDCPGVARRYHECNTNPCPGGSRNLRAEQCAAFDRRPFRGRFYTWVPYVDGDSPCTLNCRPLGQQFYASLAFVADGTPCTRPGFRAICVQGDCKVVGRESVLAASSSRELQCGGRLVTGFFSRLHLPLGYSYVATIPRGACSLNVSEVSSSENYIALKITNGSYILNGMFAISAPGNYEVAGTSFTYSRFRNIDFISALGPIQAAVDIMVLYTEDTVEIKYQYFIESSPVNENIETATSKFSEIFYPAKHLRRHHNLSKHPNLSSSTSSDDGFEDLLNQRKFMWKILSFSQCSRTCGGGIQFGKYRCVEDVNGIIKEVSQVHCTEPIPPVHRRKCGQFACLPRWRATIWSKCPDCGPAVRTRNVGCVQDQSRGIIKVRDYNCLDDKPATSEICNIPDCLKPTVDVIHMEPRRRVPEGHLTDTFRDVPVYSVNINDINTNIGPKYTIGSTAGWLYTDWSECVGWCVGGGIQSRGVICADPAGCIPRTSNDSFKSCITNELCDSREGQWFTGAWSRCSSTCRGKQVRGVLCIGGTGKHIKEAACKGPKPISERECGNDDCKPSWYYSKWSQCIGNCTTGQGFQSRTVWCAQAGQTTDETNCDDRRPDSQKYCTLHCSTVTYTSTMRPVIYTIESQNSPQYEPLWEPSKRTIQNDFVNIKESQNSPQYEPLWEPTKIAIQNDFVNIKESQNTAQFVPYLEPTTRTIQNSIQYSIDNKESQETTRHEAHSDPKIITMQDNFVNVEESRTTAKYQPELLEAETPTHPLPPDCVDKLNNCALAVQARLCHYSYYINKCCFSCRGKGPDDLVFRELGGRSKTLSL